MVCIYINPEWISNVCRIKSLKYYLHCFELITQPFTRQRNRFAQKSVVFFFIIIIIFYSVTTIDLCVTTGINFKHERWQWQHFYFRYVPLYQNSSKWTFHHCFVIRIFLCEARCVHTHFGWIIIYIYMYIVKDIFNCQMFCSINEWEYLSFSFNRTYHRSLCRTLANWQSQCGIYYSNINVPIRNESIIQCLILVNNSCRNKIQIQINTENSHFILMRLNGSI